MTTATPTIDRERLRTTFADLPAPALAAVRKLFTDRALPTLGADNADAWDDEKLYALVVDVEAAVTEAGYVAFTAPVRTETLRERIMALPDDLADFAAMEAKEESIPNVAHAPKWTVRMWRKADEILTHAESIASQRLKWVMASLRGAGVTDDDLRHSLVSIVTNGRTESAKGLTGPEARHLAKWCDDTVADETVLAEHLTPFEPDWKAEARAMGVTQADLLKQAKEWFKAHRDATGQPLPSPKKLADVTDHRAIASLLTFATDGSSVVAATDEALSQESIEAPSVTDEALEALLDEEDAIARGETPDGATTAPVEVDEVTSLCSDRQEALADVTEAQAAEGMAPCLMTEEDPAVPSIIEQAAILRADDKEREDAKRAAELAKAALIAKAAIAVLDVPQPDLRTPAARLLSALDKISTLRAELAMAEDTAHMHRAELAKALGL